MHYANEKSLSATWRFRPAKTIEPDTLHLSCGVKYSRKLKLRGANTLEEPIKPANTNWHK
jgi:hypothetical protein